LWDHAQPFLILSRNFFYFMKPGLLWWGKLFLEAAERHFKHK
jgi:hypothetical protein